MLTAETLPRHELIGLRVRVVESSDSTLVGCEGSVVMETANTLTVRAGSRTRQVPKAVVTLEFALPDGEYVTVDGERLLTRPARRTERTGGSQWQ
ncbi:ribonuclease P protein component 1 [Halocatena pleomorpha]|uniref:Ribonuclease P protein component 1 n=1 Tax=Halocatena pleomorpha TaxID=1785090 RepID=A0A3P3R9Z8_9EURY|nr:ribonuclease P protein component 1 [Halocatena pleomorpha]RRJ30296.1 ribonuclease P protein component 1 [Halocatena pleomorpha]